MCTPSAPPPPYSVRRPLRILCLDGGGIRGLAMLFVLQDLMDRIKVWENLAGTPLPYEWFDLIVGTSTGGFIALMLGRLKMSVNAAIEAYNGFAKEVFHTETRSWLNRFNPVATLPRYSTDKLEAGIRIIVKDAKVAGDAKLAESETHPRCRVAVVALRLVDAESFPDLLKTYVTDSSHEYTILDAARATSAATTFFPPAKVKFRHSHHVIYLDGGQPAYNNPSRLAVDEAERIWGADRKFGCIVSIGTGILQNVHFGGNKLALAKKLVDISTACQAANKSINNHLGDMQKRIYFRFDPPTDLVATGLYEWEKLDVVAELTHAYVQGDQGKLDDCIAAITQSVGIWRLSGRVAGSADHCVSFLLGVVARCRPGTNIGKSLLIRCGPIDRTLVKVVVTVYITHRRIIQSLYSLLCPLRLIAHRGCQGLDAGERQFRIGRRFLVQSIGRH